MRGSPCLSLEKSSMKPIARNRSTATARGAYGWFTTAMVSGADATQFEQVFYAGGSIAPASLPPVALNH